MKKLSLIFILSLMSFALNAQELKGIKIDTSAKDTLSVNTGLEKKIFYTLPDSGIKTPYGNAKVKIASIESDGVTLFAYVIGYGSKSAYLQYEDLLKSIKALKELKKESVSDLALNPDYLENKFTSGDFKMLYKVEQGKLTWYLIIERGLIKVKDVSNLERNLKLALDKMNQLLKPTK